MKAVGELRTTVYNGSQFGHTYEDTLSMADLLQKLMYKNRCHWDVLSLATIIVYE